MSDDIEFHGHGPFDLPVAQQSSASRSGNTVLVAFRVLTDPNRLVTVRIAVPNNQALELAGQIARGAAEASVQDDEK
jgi:hypothetical protein